MNICFMIPRMEVGGAERVLVEIAIGLKDLGYNIYVCSSGGFFVKQLEENFILHLKCEHLSAKNPVKLILALMELRAFFRQNKIDIINVHAFTLLPIAKLLTLVHKKTRVHFTLHIPEKDIYYDIMAKTLPFLCDSMNTVCMHTLKILNEMGLNKKLGSVCYNGISQTWLLERIEIEQKTAMKDVNKVRLGVLARIIERKGHKVILEALSILRKKQSALNFILDIAGDGDYLPILKEEVQKMSLNDCVFFHGTRTDTKAFIDSLDVFVLPSFFEGFPMSILEAMARGVPVVASSVNGVPEVVIENKTGWLFQAGDSVKLADILEEISNNQEKIKEYRLNAYDLLSSKFLTRNMIKSYELLFR